MDRGERNDPELDSLDDGDERLSKEQWQARALAAEERAAAAEKDRDGARLISRDARRGGSVVKADGCNVCAGGMPGACICRLTDRRLRGMLVSVIVEAGKGTTIHGWPLWVLGHNLAVAGALADSPAKMERVLREAGGVLLQVAKYCPTSEKLSTLHGVAIRLLEPGHPTVKDIWRAKHWAEWVEAWAEGQNRIEELP